MVASSVNARPFSTSFYNMLANAGLANGVLVSDSDNAVKGKYLVRYGTKAEIDLLVLDQGEIGITTDTNEIRIGNGATAGGISHSNSSPSCIVVAPTGTALQNGAALRAAYTAAAALTPQGAAISSSNPAWVKLEPGVYNITGGAATLDLATNVGIIGSGVDVTTIVADSTSRLNHASGITSILKNFTYSGSSIRMIAGGASYTLDWSDLYLSVGAGVTSIGFGSTLATIAGTVRRVRTDGKSLLGGVGSLTITAKFEDCEGGDNSFGGSTVIGSAGVVSGGLYRCRMFGTVSHISIAGPMVDCDWGDDIEKCTSAAEIYRNIIRATDGSGRSIGNNGSSVTIKGAAYNLMAGTIGNGVTNGLSATLDSLGNAPTSGIT